jgi:hypothetical protein
MGRVRGVPLWLGAGLLLGIPFALALSAATAVAGNLTPDCNTNRLALPVGAASVAIVSAGAGWWASRGVSLSHGFLAGGVVGVLVAGALLALPLAGLVPNIMCGAPPAAPTVAPPVSTTSMVIQSAVSFVVEVILLAGLYGLLAAAIRSGRGRRRGR